MLTFDSTDRAILNFIQADSRMTIREMAKELNLSTTPIFERLKKLERVGVIDRYVALCDPSHLGKKLTAFIQITIQDHSKEATEAFAENVQHYNEVMECHHITGDADFLVKVQVEDIEAYNLFVTEKLSTAPNIDKIRSSFSLSRNKYTTAIEV